MNVNIPPHPPTPSYVVLGSGTSLYIQYLWIYLYLLYIDSRPGNNAWLTLRRWIRSSDQSWYGLGPMPSRGVCRLLSSRSQEHVEDVLGGSEYGGTSSGTTTIHSTPSQRQEVGKDLAQESLRWWVGWHSLGGRRCRWTLGLQEAWDYGIEEQVWWWWWQEGKRWG